jgi:hypothetical protein
VREGAEGGEKARVEGKSNQRFDGNKSRHRVNTVTMPAIMMERSLNDLCSISILTLTLRILIKYTFRTDENDMVLCIVSAGIDINLVVSGFGNFTAHLLLILIGCTNV